MIIKVCGMRDAANIEAVEALKPTMMGFICWDKSPRYVSRRPLYMPVCLKTGVFVDADADYIVSKVRELSLDYIQLHGSESPEFCTQIKNITGLKVIKAVPVKDASFAELAELYTKAADLLLFDTKCSCKGGSGEQFDWTLIDTYQGSLPFLLSGGIGADDAIRIKEIKNPCFAGIDLNSRFEISAALKDVEKLRSFINQIRV